MSFSEYSFVLIIRLGETESEVHDEKKFITSSNEVFKTFENKKIENLSELCEAGRLPPSINFTKYLHIQRHKWPIYCSLSGMGPIALSFMYSNQLINPS